MLNFKFKDENSENVKTVRVNVVVLSFSAYLKNRAFYLRGEGKHGI